MHAARRWLVRAAFSGALAACALIGARQASRHFVFRGCGRAAVPSSGARALVVEAPSGVQVHALELPSDGVPWVVHFHDNTQTAEEALGFGRALHARGLGVVVMEYRGYGAAQGLEPSEPALVADAEVLLAALAARGIGPERVLLSGRSLGTGIAAELARRGRGAALVLVAPFTSIVDLVREAAPWSPASLLVRDPFDTASKTAQIAVPTLVVHGDADEIVPFHMGETLASAIPRARLLRVAGANHADVLDREAPRVLASIAALATTSCR